MTTQSESSSPFQDKTGDRVEATPAIFSFRTMKDDLLALQKNNTPDIMPDSSLPKKEERVKTVINDAPKKDISVEKLNPFFAQASTLAASNNGGPFSETAQSKEANPIEVPTPKTKSLQTSNFTYRFILAVILFLSIGIVGLGGYYFWMTRSTEQSPQVAQPVTETTLPAEEPEVIVLPVEKYSAVNPNYLIVDLASASDTDIRASVSTVASEIKELPVNIPYEFVIVDTNNNPVAFPIFATAAKLNLSPTLLSALGENFSLFISNDEGNSRLGVSVLIQKAAALDEELQKQEKTFVADASFLFLDAVPEVKAGTFSTDIYNNITTRYLNVNQQNNLSVDYSILDSQLIIGTSKNMQRALLDKISTQTIPTGTTSVENAEVTTTK